jgi:hypothetical protein
MIELFGIPTRHLALGGIFIAWLVLSIYVFPKLGIPT